MSKYNNSPESHASSKGEERPEVSKFKDTLNLPRTDFPIRADTKVNDPIMLERWTREALYAKAAVCHEGAKKFILHDGPPYANGHIHLGHAYNKILKDIITKAHRMMGHHVPVIPGWDCHGLPIEHKVSQENPELKGAELKKACRDYAMEWVNIQREEFKKLGVIMEWDNPYITMNPAYEESTLTAFALLVARGCIERKNKTIPWCPHCKTTLASAEIEYANRKDPSLYVLFELDAAVQKQLFSAVHEPISFVVWTTTPWTLPLNRAILLKTGAEYQLLKIKDRYVVVAAALADKLAALVESEKHVVATVRAEEFEGGRVRHPFIENLSVPIILDQSVGLDEGTAVVHCAPGCGPIDYEIGVKHKLEIYSPVDAAGNYTAEIKPQELAGMSVADGQIWVIKALAAAGKLFHKTSINHSYPHCWRCHGALIFRATPQWFCNLERSNIKEQALQEIEKINFIPAQGKSFLRSTVESRWEWCLSRQRSWGVPIPALINIHNNSVYNTHDIEKQAIFIANIAAKVAHEGIEYWDRVSLQDLINENFLPADFPIQDYRKETDILDVWFDSGISHWAVLTKRDEFPADVYLEGIDQHRGWFQSSLLTSVIINGVAPMRTIMTHGFTVDAKGHKMSKSLGNVVAPQEIINRLGTDALRLWVASIGNDGDAVVSDTLLINVEQVFRKVRNTCRFLLQNLYDYDHERDAIALKDMKPFDCYAVLKLAELQEVLIEDYKQGRLTSVFHTISDYCAVEISALYGDIAKDCLYCDKKDGLKRRSTQTAFYIILDTLTRLIAPIMSFAAEQISDFYQKEKQNSIHLQIFADLEYIKKEFSAIDREDLEKQWKILHAIRSAVLKLIEVQREQGVVKHSLEAAVNLHYAQWDTLTVLGNSNESRESFLKDFFIVSQVELKNSSEGLQQTLVKDMFGSVVHAAGTKCPRCWQWDTQTDADGLCRRCQKAVK